MKATVLSLLVSLAAAPAAPGPSATVYEAFSAYHHIRVYDQEGLRVLSFDGSMETRMSLKDARLGHFEYTEYFHMPWLWNTQLTRVLMVGLGGASTQRAFQRYYPDVQVETVEIDLKVLEVAREFFHYEPTDRQRVEISDGRMFLRRSQTNYGAILMDAYVQGRYGSSLPHHLATREFFELASRHLTTNGVLAYNAMGTTVGGRGAGLVGTLYNTMKQVFPQVYLFPAKETQNVVLLGTKSAAKADLIRLQQKAAVFLQSRRLALPTFRERLQSFRVMPPSDAHRSPVLTDDFAPIDGLLPAGY